MKKKTVPTLRAYSEQLSQQLRANGQIRTARAYRGAVNQLTNFLGRNDLSFREIDRSMMTGFQEYFLCRGRRMNTVSFYMRQLRSMYNQAIEAGLFKRKGDPFEQVFTGNAATVKRALSEEELAKVVYFEIELLPPPNETAKKEASERSPGKSPEDLQKELETARQYLLFAFYGCGISFVDLCFLRKADIRDGHIHYFRKKTGKELVIHINRNMQKVIDFFAGQVKDSPYLFPILDMTKPNLRRQYETALDKQNRLLKQLGKMVGLARPLTTHVVRHSWATISLKRGASVSLISRGLGHSDEKTTAIYLASFTDPELRRLNKKIAASLDKKAPALRTQ